MWVAGLLACATPAPQLALPPFGQVAAVEVDPGCSPNGCPPPQMFRDRAEVAYLLALHHALNKDWEDAEPELCRPTARPRRTTYLAADGQPLLVMWEHIDASGVQLAYGDPRTGCQATPVWTRKQYASAMEAARVLYHQMLSAEQAGQR